MGGPRNGGSRRLETREKAEGGGDLEGWRAGAGGPVLEGDQLEPAVVAGRAERRPQRERAREILRYSQRRRGRSPMPIYVFREK